MTGTWIPVESAADLPTDDGLDWVTAIVDNKERVSCCYFAAGLRPANIITYQKAEEPEPYKLQRLKLFRLVNKNAKKEC